LDAAIEVIRENPGGPLAKTELINGFTLSRIDSLYKEDSQRAAVRQLMTGYLCTHRFFFLTARCLVVGEAMKPLRPRVADGG
jgi:hypothetical protein